MIVFLCNATSNALCNAICLIASGRSTSVLFSKRAGHEQQNRGPYSFPLRPRTKKILRRGFQRRNVAGHRGAHARADRAELCFHQSKRVFGWERRLVLLLRKRCRHRVCINRRGVRGEGSTGVVVSMPMIVRRVVRVAPAAFQTRGHAQRIHHDVMQTATRDDPSRGSSAARAARRQHRHRGAEQLCSRDGTTQRHLVLPIANDVSKYSSAIRW